MSNGRRSRPNPQNQSFKDLLSRIKLADPSVDLFDQTASQAARIIAQASGGRNKTTQLRRFYDELVMWDTRVHQPQGQKQSQELLQEYLPFIRMMNAKAAYADGRRLVDRNFKDLLSECLKQVKDPETLRNCRTFFEAFMGFYKAEKPN